MIWPAVIVGSLGAYLLKLAGYVIPERVLDNPRLQRLTAILPIALLAALVGVQTFSTGDAVQVDARVAGLAAAIVALALRAPFLVVILVAAATAAVLRGAGLAP
ncbi:MAG: AzlD domain-containing protein [Actinomycetales bacterium]|nr:AzlD domain-containing protein [Actinomycetales bacterium]MCP4894525.1 AzlD domain-containing protein [Actinomycetales bacterium]